MNTITPITLPYRVRAPCYDRQQLQSHIVYSGFGAFHRTHQALLTDRMLSAQGSDWEIYEISLFSGDQLMSQLRAQSRLYTVLEKGADDSQAIIIGAVHSHLNAKLDSLATIIEKLCEPQVAIISLMITEKGYCVDPATGVLDTSNPRIIRSPQNPEEPHPAPGILVEALKRHRERDLTPFTVSSCDSIPDNDHVVKNAVLGVAEGRSSKLAGWIEEHVSFPGTMVDRIAPAATDESLAEIGQYLGMNDPYAVSCEPFIQWVMRDNFVAGRPTWEVADVQVADDVLPWEEMKLCMFNGNHSFLTYLSYLSGSAHVSDYMQDRAFRHTARALTLDEQAPTLQIKDVDLTQCADKLVACFANPALKHKT